ncbi:unnamed protein product [Cylicostephanus goldi]|uniref:Uncharacterized protein n=1 Tax=Cylicostephanus goldi TaxID=71465 RepID=A0A3P7MJ41_CYLGO|nr:unnamed protein product [Cylicostephanus goldi]
MAVVLVDEGHDRRDIIIRKRCETLERIAETRSYDAIHVWDGDGHHLELWQRKPSTGALTNEKVSVMDFYAHHMMIKSTSINHVARCRQLFHQFIVNMYAKTENE